MSDRQTHDDKCEATGSNYIVYCRCTERRLERQLDAAVDALKNLMESESRGRVMPIGNAWDAARAALREIEGKS